MRRLSAILVLTFAIASPAFAQLLSQSKLTPRDADPNFEITLEHLALDGRWLGLSPRAVTWSPDGEWLYFRWREDPASGQVEDADPWYLINRAGTSVRRATDEEVQRVPSQNISWSAKREVAAWSTSGTLFVWTSATGARPVFTSASRLGNVLTAADGARVFFATKGFQAGVEGGGGSAGDESGDLWAYDVGQNHVRQIATTVEKRKDPDKPDKWLEEQQLDLIEIVTKRKGDRETRETLGRAREPFRAQVIPVERGTRLANLRLSPDGRYLTFQWIKRPSDDLRTSFLEFVNESGQATEKRARPKVVEPLPEYKLGIVKVDPLIDPQKVEITWADDGIEKKTILHGPYWDPTGRHAVVQILSMDHKDRWISALDVATGRTRVIHHEHQDEWIGGAAVGGRWSPGYLEWLPDGSAFGFVSEETAWAMFTLATPDGKVTRLTNGDWEVRHVALGADGAWYLTTSREHPGEDQLYRLPAQGGELTRLTAGEGRHTTILAPHGGRLARLSQSPRQMADLYVADLAPGAAPARITKSGTDAFYRIPWVASEIVTFDDPKGLPTWAEVWQKPARPNGAAVVYVHGCGECAQAVHKGWYANPNLYANYLIRKGYTFASLDYRGSTGYGHANRTYAYRQMGVSDVDSGLPLVDLLATKYGVDRSRVGIYGGSYGGFFTLMALFRHPGVFRAGVALYPVTDWAHYNQGYTSRILNGSPLDDQEAYKKSSPMYYADGLKDALQIQHGLVDDNVQIQDSFRLAQRLMEKKKTFDLVVYPMEDHGWDEVPTRRDSYRRMTEWFDRHLLLRPGQRITSY